MHQWCQLTMSSVLKPAHSDNRYERPFLNPQDLRKWQNEERSERIFEIGTFWHHFCYQQDISAHLVFHCDPRSLAKLHLKFSGITNTLKIKAPSAPFSLSPENNPIDDLASINLPFSLFTSLSFLAFLSHSFIRIPLYSFLLLQAFTVIAPLLSFLIPSLCFPSFPPTNWTQFSPNTVHTSSKWRHNSLPCWMKCKNAFVVSISLQYRGIWIMLCEN